MAEVKLPALFADHMVIQRDFPVHVWGWADPGEAVTVSFRGESRATTTDELGRWQVSLPSGAAGGPFTLEVRAANSITISDVLVGDVWVASGQSNMGFQMHRVMNADAELQTADRPKIRLFQVAHATADYPLEDVKAETWVLCSPETATKFSAIGFLFARGVQDDQKVPIGVIESDWGGTPAEAWTSLPALAADASLMPVFSAFSLMTDTESMNIRDRARQVREVEAAKAAGTPEPKFPWHPELRSWMPGALYNAMIAPLVKFPIRGAIWYQGESNGGPERAPTYWRLFSTMIQDWRRNWGVGDFPFLFVQLANWKTGPEGQWPEVRDAQRRTLALRNTGMASAIDIGDSIDIHPKNKQDVAKRLVLAARAIAYGEKLEYSGPLFRAVTSEGKSLRVWFDHASSGLVAKGDVVKGFEVAGADRKFFPAVAKIEGSALVVSSDQVAAPVYVRYGWASDPEVNLYNKEGLPASPFQSE